MVVKTGNVGAYGSAFQGALTKLYRRAGSGYSGYDVTPKEASNSAHFKSCCTIPRTAMAAGGKLSHAPVCRPAVDSRTQVRRQWWTSRIV
eukprot:scaffold300122_cov18-Tisochrysis_lutea.AAC.1